MTLSFEKDHEILSQKLVFMETTSCSEDYVVLACTVLIESQSKTDRRADKRLNDSQDTLSEYG